MLDLADAKHRCNVELELNPVLTLLWSKPIARGKTCNYIHLVALQLFCAYCLRILYMPEPAGRQLHLNNAV